MGHIKEPYGIDFVVESKPLTNLESGQISEIIAHYKATGRKMKLALSVNPPSIQKKALQSKKVSGRKQSTKA